jgi:hypothetical protein
LADELRTPGGVTMRKDDLGWAWYWMMNCAPYMKLNSDEEGLLDWFRGLESLFSVGHGVNLVATHLAEENNGAIGS